jgi:hypothetical protein
MTYEMTAYAVGPTEGWVIEPDEAKREWMEQTPFKGANRCLPLVIANQAGWVIRCPFQFKVTWNGKKTHDSITFDFPMTSSAPADRWCPSSDSGSSASRFRGSSARARAWD